MDWGDELLLEPEMKKINTLGKPKYGLTIAKKAFKNKQVARVMCFPN